MADKIKVVTPVGILVFTHITGQGKENYNKDGYEFVSSVELEGEDAKKLKAEIQAVYDASHKSGFKLKSLGYKDLFKLEVDKDGNAIKDADDKVVYTDVKSGVTRFNFKTKTEWPDGSAVKVVVKNAKGNPIVLSEDVSIGNGSKGRIGGSLKHYINGREDGVSLFLGTVQIATLVKYTQDDGCTEIEGDFEETEEMGSSIENTTEQVARPKL